MASAMAAKHYAKRGMELVVRSVEVINEKEFDIQEPSPAAIAGLVFTLVVFVVAMLGVCSNPLASDILRLINCRLSTHTATSSQLSRWWRRHPRP
jgi:hypothetical protein